MSLETTMDTLAPQPVKKERSELGVPLYLPAGVVIPPFYEQERDVSAISTALQLGADAVYHLRSQAEELRLQELFEKKAYEQKQRAVELEADLAVVHEKVNEDVARRVAEQTLALKKTLQVRDDEVADLDSACQKQREEILKNLGYLEKQMEEMRQLDARLQVVRVEERQKARDGVHSTLKNVHESRVSDLRGHIKSLIDNGEEKEQLADKQTTSCEDTLERGKPSAYIKEDDHSKPTLRELIRQAFEKTKGFQLQEASEDKAIAWICELQTSWYRRDQTEVKQTKVDHIKSELEAQPEVHVAFLVALQAGIAGHTERLFDMELLKTGQALVYVNQFRADDNPADTLQVFAYPLLRALLRIKQVHAESGTDPASRLRSSARRWVETVKTHLTELAAEREELQSEMLKSQQLFDARRKRIKRRAEALEELQQDMEPSDAVPTNP